MVPPHLFMVPPYVLYESYGPHILYGIGIVWSSHMYNTGITWCPYDHVVPPHVKCLHVLYDPYCPPYCIWNRYHMVPYMYV